MISLPSEGPTNSLKLADWLEIKAFFSSGKNSSRGDLDSALRRASYSEFPNNDSIERKILEVFSEIEKRISFTGEAYPFNLENNRNIKLRLKWEKFPAYLFCLCLSYFGIQETKKTPKLFEQLSCQAVKGYLKGDVIGFGWPRQKLSNSFPEAVKELCKKIGEGVTFKEQSTQNCKDDTLDLVAWKDFNDRLPSKIIIFGQCAAGNNWDSKLSELQPGTFCKQWLQDSLVSPFPISSFFIPHRIEKDKWDFNARKAGILFDRCRIAFFAQKVKNGFDYGNHIAWIKAKYKEIDQ